MRVKTQYSGGDERCPEAHEPPDGLLASLTRGDGSVPGHGAAALARDCSSGGGTGPRRSGGLATPGLSERDVVLIAYGDHLRAPESRRSRRSRAGARRRA